jgi:hypothetical protein
VEELLLPDWREPDCPWCLELKQLEAARVPVGSLLAERRERLRAGGLTEGLFLPFSGGTRPVGLGDVFGDGAGGDDNRADGDSAMQLGPRSVFGPLRDESQVFVAVASALQNMRDAEQRNGANALSEAYTSPISRVLAPDFYLSGRFYAPVILCSILRAARRFDLRATAVEVALRREVGERYADIAAVRAEVLYAIARGILPLPSEAGNQHMIEDMDQSVRSFLARLQAGDHR